jgi:hypothetical protein
MVKWSKLVYYLDGYWTALPIASFHEIHKYAKAHQVDYVVFQARTAEEMDLINHPLPGFKLVETIASQEYYYKLAFYRPID